MDIEQAHKIAESMCRDIDIDLCGDEPVVKVDYMDFTESQLEALLMMVREEQKK